VQDLTLLPEGGAVHEQKVRHMAVADQCHSVPTWPPLMPFCRALPISTSLRAVVTKQCAWELDLLHAGDLAELLAA
jgi:hypothetical protein